MRHLLFGAVSAAAVLAADVAPAASESFDYIVVGSGPGGGPLACDLARGGYKTLLLEAGDDQGDNPTYADMMHFNEAGSDVNSRWDFWSKHSEDPEQDKKFEHYVYMQSNGSYYIGTHPPAGAKPLGIQYPRAATLGGCSMHNGGVCSLPQDDDWNLIVEKTGDKSWEASKMRKYLLKVERSLYSNSAEHSQSGEHMSRSPGSS
jgi:choline dehydrogenase